MSFFQTFDRLSFWLGFLTASLFWWLGTRLLRRFPQIKDSLLSQVKTMRARQATGSDSTLRHEVLKRAQRSHLAGVLFSLDEIVVAPRLLSPPPQIDPDHPDPIGSFRPAILPNLPFAPQFSAQYGGESLPLVQAVRSGVDLAIIGHPGSGKSTALAYLAALFARKDTSLGQIASYFPIYLHANDLEDTATAGLDPVEVLIKALSWHVPAGSRPSLAGFVQKALTGQKAILLLDGLDEIPYDAYQDAVAYLGRLIKARAKLRIVTTASLDRAHGLFNLGIEPMPIAGWTRGEISAFTRKWGSLWNAHFSPATTPDNGHSLDEVLINSWQTTDGSFYSPLELAARLWGAYSGNLSGMRGVDAVSSFFGMVDSQGVHLLALASIADQLLSAKQGFTTYMEVEKEFTSAGTPYAAFLDESADKSEPQKAALPNPLDSLRPPKQGSGALEEQSVDKLIEMGVLREHPHDRLAFTSPALWGYAASLSNYTYDLSSKSPDNAPWSAEAEFFHYLLASTPAEWLKPYLARDSAPIHRRGLQAALWMRDLNPGNANRSLIMRHIIPLVQSEDLPYPTRLGLLAAAATSNDPALGLLMKQLSGAPTAALRQIAALCTGVLRDPKSITELTTLGGDEQELVRFAAAFAIAALETPEAQTTLENSINQSDEHMRLAVAEAASTRPPWGHKLLREAAASADIFARRAAIFGLMQLKAPWVAEIIEKLAIEDRDFAVRNYAGAALEALQHGRNARLEAVAVSPYDTPWLIAFAAKNGRGVPRSESPVPLLVKVAQSGTPDQQTAAVQLLARCGDPAALNGIREAMNATDLDLRVTAFHALWFTELTQSSNN